METGVIVKLLLLCPLQTNPPQYPTYSSRDTNVQDVDHLVLKVLEVQELRKQMHQLQEELNWERQNYESLQGHTHTQGRLNTFLS